MKRAVLACSLNGLLFGGIKLLYELAGGNFSGLLYCSFLGVTVTLAVGAQWKEVPYYLGSLGFGLVWVGLYLGIEAALLTLPIGETAGKAIAFGLASFVIEAVNLFVLIKSRCKYAPLQFAVIIGCFSQGCRHIPLILLALIIGMTAGLTSKVIYAWLLKPMK